MGDGGVRFSLTHYFQNAAFEGRQISLHEDTTFISQAGCHLSPKQVKSSYLRFHEYWLAIALQLFLSIISALGDNRKQSRTNLRKLP